MWSANLSILASAHISALLVLSPIPAVAEHLPPQPKPQITPQPEAPPVIDLQRYRCHRHDLIANMLANKYQEHPVAFGLNDDGAMVEIFASLGGGTWTILVTGPDGQSCIVYAGRNWDNLPKGQRV